MLILPFEYSIAPVSLNHLAPTQPDTVLKSHLHEPQHINQQSMAERLVHRTQNKSWIWEFAAQAAVSSLSFLWTLARILRKRWQQIVTCTLKFVSHGERRVLWYFQWATRNQRRHFQMYLLHTLHGADVLSRCNCVYYARCDDFQLCLALCWLYVPAFHDTRTDVVKQYNDAITVCNFILLGISNSFHVQAWNSEGYAQFNSLPGSWSITISPTSIHQLLSRSNVSSAIVHTGSLISS